MHVQVWTGPLLKGLDVVKGHSIVKGPHFVKGVFKQMARSGKSKSRKAKRLAKKSLRKLLETRSLRDERKSQRLLKRRKSSDRKAARLRDFEPRRLPLRPGLAIDKTLSRLAPQYNYVFRRNSQKTIDAFEAVGLSKIPQIV